MSEFLIAIVSLFVGMLCGYGLTNPGHSGKVNHWDNDYD